jgi:hypothetical protein
MKWKLYFGLSSSYERREGDCVKMMNKQVKKTAAFFKLL